ncbi:uncharacterized protein LY79DRAFT_673983 [Colletotrichum navitas]|uniref:RNA recognition domain-containing protein n=1 Tax=Colletotrichum navitas TaxID=681940 RepID=A0AAD8PMI9_9PEZI|nr:uncharacterized protein LY79DRAFT_673983 [Colletotrichum navitas]KAK1572845.1 hypothetical protein LY79DRAFT_673983 [Colletotrichum navitas]
MAGTQSTCVSPQGGAPLDRPPSPVDSAHAQQVSNNNAMTYGNRDNGVLLNDYDLRSANTNSAPGSSNSEHDLLLSTPDVRHTQVPAVSHNHMTSCDHIMDQDAQTNDYNNLPGAQPPLSAEGRIDGPVQQFSQLTVDTTNIQFAEGVSDYSTAPNARSSTLNSRSSDSWLHGTSVTHKAGNPDAGSRDSPANRIPEASLDLTKQGESSTAATTIANEGKNKRKAPQGIYTSSSSGSSTTRFSPNHTSNHHIEARIETKPDPAIGSSKPSGSKNGWVAPHLRGGTHDGQVQRPIREPIAPGPFQGVVPLNNFDRRAPASSQANGRRGLTCAPHHIFNVGFNSAGAASQLAAHQRQPIPAPSFNLAIGTFQGNGSVPHIGNIRQAPVGALPSAAVASFGSAQPAGDAVSMASAVAGQGPVSFAPAGIFRPMNAVTRPFHHPDLDSQRELKAQLGISPNYAGDATIPRNQSAPIPDSQNVAFWITNLPPNVTHSQLLGQIHGIGRIWACVISPPTGDHVTAAAKLVFFELAAAQKFYAHCSNPRRRLIVGGHVAHVCLNRTKKAEEDVGGNRSRVVVIMGDPSFVNPRTLLQWFRNHFEYEIDDIITHVLNKEMGHVEIRFGSWRSQAESCRQAIKTVYPPGGAQSPVWVFRYGTDPCSI